jgi:hypothetical protein
VVVISNTPAGRPLATTPVLLDNQVDGDSNGAQPGGSGSAVYSVLVNLALNAEPLDTTTETGLGNAVDNVLPGDEHGELTVDFGFMTGLSIGNRVWKDLDDNGLINGLEVGIDMVIVQLFAADGSGNPTGAALRSTLTTGGGYYRFGGLPPGDYIVVVPASNFGPGQPLNGLYSSGTAAGTFNGIDPDVVLTDSDDNGFNAINPLMTGVRTAAISLSFGSEPGGLDLGAGDVNDANSNLTVDLGFSAPPPTAIRLRYFKGWSLNGHVTVEWATANELNTLGFDLYRLESDGRRVLVNVDLVPALNQAAGAVYRVFDDHLPVPSRQRYELVELETTGVVNTYGPFEVLVRAAAVPKGLRVTATEVEVSFSGEPGTEYEIESTDDLKNGHWDSSGRVRADENGAILLRDALRSTMKFYRALLR